MWMAADIGMYRGFVKSCRIDARVNKDEQDQEGWTSFTFASKLGHTEVVEGLMDHGDKMDILE